MSDNLPPLPHHIMVENIWTLESFIMTGENPKEAWQAMKSLRAIAAIEADRVSRYVPAGWKLVPVEPTTAMVNSGADCDPERESVWTAMLAAAAQPQPVAQPVLAQPSEAATAESQVLTFSDVASRVCRAVAELPDRNSPEGWPDAMLVTQSELHGIMMDALDEWIDCIASMQAQKEE